MNYTFYICILFYTISSSLSYPPIPHKKKADNYASDIRRSTALLKDITETQKFKRTVALANSNNINNKSDNKVINTLNRPYVIFRTNIGRNITVQSRSANFEKDFGDFLSDEEWIDTAIVEGLWMFYSDRNYNWNESNNTRTQGSMKWLYGNGTNGNTMLNFFSDPDSSIKSLRSAGDQQNYGTNGVTFYLGEYFTGPEYFTNETDYLNIPFTLSKSLIVMGNETWTFFTAANFVQKTLCIIKHDPTDFTPTFLPNYKLHMSTRPLRHLNSAWRGTCPPGGHVFKGKASTAGYKI